MESATNATGKVAALRADESFFVRIHTNEVIHIIIRIRIRCGFYTNSYNFLYELYSTHSYNEPMK